MTSQWEVWQHHFGAPILERHGQFSGRTRRCSRQNTALDMPCLRGLCNVYVVNVIEYIQIVNIKQKML